MHFRAFRSADALRCNEYVHNGFKVGPNYSPPAAPVAQHWIDDADKRVRTNGDDLSQWWTVFNDPVLDTSICRAYQQNLTLREAGCRVLQARAQLGIATGQIFPQTQTMTGRLHAQCHQRANRQRPVHTEAVLQPMELRFQSQLGTRFLGPVPPGDRIELRRAWTPRSRTTTTSWSRCWATWPPTTCRCGPSKGASSTPKRTCDCSKRR